MKNQFIENEIATLIAPIETQRKAWEAGPYKASNDMLYDLLAKCLELYLQIKRKRKSIKCINKELDTRGLPHNAKTSLAVKVIRLIFGECGNRVFAFATVLIEADKCNIDSIALPKWISDQDGIENIRKSKSGKDKISDAQLAENGVELFNTIDAIFEFPEQIKNLEPHPEATNEFAVALVRPGSNGSTEIVFGTNKQSIVNKVLGEASRVLSPDNDAANALAKSQQSQEDVHAAIQSAQAAE